MEFFGLMGFSMAVIAFVMVSDAEKKVKKLKNNIIDKYVYN